VRRPSRARRHPIRINYIASCLHLYFMLIELSVNPSRASSDYARRAERIPISSASMSLSKSARLFLGSSDRVFLSYRYRSPIDSLSMSASLRSASELLFESVPRRRLQIRFNCALNDDHLKPREMADTATRLACTTDSRANRPTPRCGSATDRRRIR